MRFPLFLAALCLLIGGCDHASEPDLEPGTARVEIEQQTVTARATLSTKKVGEASWALVEVRLPGGARVELLQATFRPGRWSSQRTDPETGFLASYYDDGFSRFFYTAETGTLTVDQVTETGVRGRFDVDCINALSSCYNCPGTRKRIKGRFYAVEVE